MKKRPDDPRFRMLIIAPPGERSRTALPLYVEKLRKQMMYKKEAVIEAVMMEEATELLDYYHQQWDVIQFVGFGEQKLEFRRKSDHSLVEPSCLAGVMQLAIDHGRTRLVLFTCNNTSAFGTALRESKQGSACQIVSTLGPVTFEQVLQITVGAIFDQHST